MVEIKSFVFNSFQVNTYVISDENSEGYIIDAACSGEEELKELTQYLSENEISVKALINTHCHIDHILGIEFLRKNLGVDFYCSEEEQLLLNNSVAQGNFFGLDVEETGKPDKYISEESNLPIGETKIDIYHVPGHSPGSLVFHLKEEKSVFCGDVLFSGSIGRTDLPGGDYNTLVAGIKNKLLVLDDDTRVYPGHGPATTIGNEKLLNPFLQ